MPIVKWVLDDCIIGSLNSIYTIGQSPTILTIPEIFSKHELTVKIFGEHLDSPCFISDTLIKHLKEKSGSVRLRPCFGCNQFGIVDDDSRFICSDECKSISFTKEVVEG
jgi:hypothetical protein